TQQRGLPLRDHEPLAPVKVIVVLHRLLLIPCAPGNEALEGMVEPLEDSIQTEVTKGPGAFRTINLNPALQRELLPGTLDTTRGIYEGDEVAVKGRIFLGNLHAYLRKSASGIVPGDAMGGTIAQGALAWRLWPLRPLSLIGFMNGQESREILGVTPPSGS